MKKNKTFKTGSILLVMLLPLFMYSCKSKMRSGDLLPPKTMQKILMDINLAEAYSLTVKDSLHRGGTKNLDSLPAFYNDIFNHYHITEEQFAENYDWYKEHPQELDSFYASIMPVFTKWQPGYKNAGPQIPMR